MKKKPLTAASAIEHEYKRYESNIKLATARTMQAMTHAAQAGGLCVKQKEIVGHGEWQKWVRENLSISHDTVNSLMCAHRQKTQGRVFSSLAQAERMDREDRAARRAALTDPSDDAPDDADDDYPDGYTPEAGAHSKKYGRWLHKARTHWDELNPDHLALGASRQKRQSIDADLALIEKKVARARDAIARVDEPERNEVMADEPSTPVEA